MVIQDFLEIGSLDVSDFLHNDGEQGILKCDGTQVSKKKGFLANFGTKWPKNMVI